jgi:hypothetical protein
MLPIGSKAQFAGITHDEFDRPIVTRAALKIIRVNNTDRIPRRGWDYEVESISSGNRFYVFANEIIPCCDICNKAVPQGTGELWFQEVDEGAVEARSLYCDNCKEPAIAPKSD